MKQRREGKRVKKERATDMISRSLALSRLCLPLARLAIGLSARLRHR